MAYKPWNERVAEQMAVKEQARYAKEYGLNVPLSACKQVAKVKVDAHFGTESSAPASSAAATDADDVDTSWWDSDGYYHAS